MMIYSLPIGEEGKIKYSGKMEQPSIMSKIEAHLAGITYIPTQLQHAQ
jgi:hypothetical protein